MGFKILYISVCFNSVCTSLWWPFQGYPSAWPATFPGVTSAGPVTFPGVPSAWPATSEWKNWAKVFRLLRIVGIQAAPWVSRQQCSMFYCPSLQLRKQYLCTWEEYFTNWKDARPQQHSHILTFQVENIAQRFREGSWSSILCVCVWNGMLIVRKLFQCPSSVV